MSNNIYRTAQGKTLDLGQVQMQNETVRAVGNMGVNARGDRLDSQNQIIEKRARMAAQYYAQQVAGPMDGNVVDEPVIASRRALAEKQTEADTSVVKVVAQDAPVQTPDGLLLNIDPSTVVDPTATAIPAIDPAKIPSSVISGGLAAAIARSRDLSQAVPTATSTTPGLKRI
jgi:hypothetical protein